MKNKINMKTKTIISIIALISLLILSGCQTNNPRSNARFAQSISNQIQEQSKVPDQEEVTPVQNTVPNTKSAVVQEGSINATANVQDNILMNANKEDYQIIRMDVTRQGWMPNKFVLKKGVPTKWIITGKEITGCNNAIIVPKYNLQFRIISGEQTIEFTPDEAGVVPWSCWMGMIKGTFVVVE